MENKNIFYIGNIKYEFNLDLMRFIDSTELMTFLVEKESVVSSQSRSVTDKETEVKQFLIKKVQTLQASARSSITPTAEIPTLNAEGTIPADVLAKFDCEVIDGVLKYNNERSQDSSQLTPVALSTKDNEFTIDMLDQDSLEKFTRAEVQPVDHTFLYSLDDLANLTLTSIVYKVIIPWFADTNHFMNIALKSQNQLDFITNALNNNISSISFGQPTDVSKNIKAYYYLSPSSTVNKFVKYKIMSILDIDNFNDVVCNTAAIAGLLNELKTGGFNFYNFSPNNTTLFEQERKIFFGSNATGVQSIYEVYTEKNNTTFKQDLTLATKMNAEAQKSFDATFAIYYKLLETGTVKLRHFRYAALACNDPYQGFHQSCIIYTNITDAQYSTMLKELFDVNAMKRTDLSGAVDQPFKIIDQKFKTLQVSNPKIQWLQTDYGISSCYSAPVYYLHTIGGIYKFSSSIISLDTIGNYDQLKQKLADIGGLFWNHAIENSLTLPAPSKFSTATVTTFDSLTRKVSVHTYKIYKERVDATTLYFSMQCKLSDQANKIVDPTPDKVKAEFLRLLKIEGYIINTKDNVTSKVLNTTIVTLYRPAIPLSKIMTRYEFAYGDEIDFGGSYYASMLSEDRIQITGKPLGDENVAFPERPAYSSSKPILIKQDTELFFDRAFLFSTYACGTFFGNRYHFIRSNMTDEQYKSVLSNLLKANQMFDNGSGLLVALVPQLNIFPIQYLDLKTNTGVCDGGRTVKVLFHATDGIYPCYTNDPTYFAGCANFDQVIVKAVNAGGYYYYLPKLATVGGTQFYEIDSTGKKLIKWYYPELYHGDNIKATYADTHRWNDLSRELNGANPDKKKFEDAFRADGFDYNYASPPVSSEKDIEIRYLWRFSEKDGFLMTRYTYALTDYEYAAENISRYKMEDNALYSSYDLLNLWIGNTNNVEIPTIANTVKPILIEVRDVPAFLYHQNNGPNWAMQVFQPMKFESLDMTLQINKNAIREEYVNFLRTYTKLMPVSSVGCTPDALLTALGKTDYRMHTFYPATSLQPIFNGIWSYQSMGLNKSCFCSMDLSKLYSNINNVVKCVADCTSASNTYASCPNAGGCMQLVYAEEAQKNRHLFLDVNKS